MPQTLSEIKALLAAHGLHAKHRFGQNFLHDANQMRRILAAAAIAPGDVVLEVGPGTGALSEWLLEAGSRLVMVEIDRDLEPILREHVVSRWPDRATLVTGDVLASKRGINPAVWDAMLTLEPSPPGRGQGEGSSERPRRSEKAKCPHPSPLPRGEGGATLAHQSFKLIANLPYNIASPLLANLVSDHPEMRLAVVMIQREVADRLTAAPGGKDYGPLGVLVQAMCEVERVAVLPPGCFWPPPKVASAVVRLRRREQPLTDDPHALSAMLHRLFSKRRKQIGAILGRAHPLPDGVASEARPEQLSVEQLVAISRVIP